MRLREPLPFLLVVAIGACGDASGVSDATRAETRDSAGVAIVEFDTADAALPVWAAVDSPAVSIGELEAAPEYMLEDVRAAFRLDDGRIVVADEGASAVRFYDASGRHIASTGREGEGPGEFRSMWVTFLGPGDSIHVWDYALRRLTLIAPTGEFVRVLPVEATAVAAPMPVGRLSDGRILVSAAFGFNEPPGESRLIRDSVPLAVYSGAGTLVDSIGRWPTTEVYVHVGETVIVGPAPFGRATTIGVVGDTIVIADNARPEVAFHDDDGALLRVVRNTASPRPLTPAIEEEYRSAADDPEIPERFRRRIREAPMPETLPAFGHAVIGRDGVVGCRTTGLAGRRARSAGWSSTPAVRSRACRPRTDSSCTRPATTSCSGVQRDDLGVERVVLLPLRRPAP